MQQHQDYDKIVKENIKKSQAAILQYVCKVPITPTTSTYHRKKSN